MTLKSDGHLSYDDSNGYHTNLGQVSTAAGWRISQVLQSPIYRHVRSAFADGRVPWPGTCEGCDCLHAGAAAHDTLDHEISIRVEPTLACTLRCPSCKRLREASRRPDGSWHLDPAVLAALVRSCVKSGIAVPAITYVGWGEPLEHPDFPALVAASRAESPISLQHLTTVGNVDFRRSMGEAELDEIVVSCDGVTPASYGKYRRGGDLEATLRFLRDAPRYAAGQPHVQWKYIVFDHNDTDAELRAAQEVADDCGIGSLMFVLTNSKGRSARFDGERLRDFPLISPRASVTPAAALLKVAAEGELTDRASLGQRGETICYVDRCDRTIAGVLVVQGWAGALDGRKIALSVSVNSSAPTACPLELIRADVSDAYPSVGRRSGFIVRLPAPADDALELELVATDEAGMAERFSCGFRLHEREAEERRAA